MSRINTKEILNRVVPLKKVSNDNFHIVNVVGIVHLLNQGEGICIESLSLYFGGMVKYAPKCFAAAVLRIKDIISTTTCLVFRSGKLVCVGALTKYHLLLACQTYRQLLEKVIGIYRDKVTYKLRNINLEGRTQFTNWGIQNIVAHDNLNCKPNLKYIAKIIPEVANWNPELFPGLKLLVWIKKKASCCCLKKKKNNSCQCNLRVLLFDTGKYVTTGSTDIESIAMGTHIIKTLFSDNEYLNTMDPAMNHLSKFQTRNQQIINDAFIEFAGYRSYKKTTMGEETDRPMNIDYLMKGLKKVVSVKKMTDEEQKEELLQSPFIRACKYDQIENVNFILSFDKRAVKEALEYCKVHKESFSSTIMAILKENAL
jgi:TATA-box binding protein (TBP) (component of TFIID and TFIIIB)